MPVYTRVNRAGIRAAFALVILIILGIAWLTRFAVRAVRSITGPRNNRAGAGGEPPS